MQIIINIKEGVNQEEAMREFAKVVKMATTVKGKLEYSSLTVFPATGIYISVETKKNKVYFTIEKIVYEEQDEEEEEFFVSIPNKSELIN